jgi:hypothetical protein
MIGPTDIGGLNSIKSTFKIPLPALQNIKYKDRLFKAVYGKKYSVCVELPHQTIHSLGIIESFKMLSLLL